MKIKPYVSYREDIPSAPFAVGFRMDASAQRVAPGGYVTTGEPTVISIVGGKEGAKQETVLLWMSKEQFMELYDKMTEVGEKYVG